jgi:hypothetical protein
MKDKYGVNDRYGARDDSMQEVSPVHVFPSMDADDHLEISE